MNRMMVPVRGGSWLAGELGTSLHEYMQRTLKELEDVIVTRMPKGFLVETTTAIGVTVERIVQAVHGLEGHVHDHYPVFYTEMGPVCTGTLQVVFPAGRGHDDM